MASVTAQQEVEDTLLQCTQDQMESEKTLRISLLFRGCTQVAHLLPIVLTPVTRSPNRWWMMADT
jgi:hypothetical protein